MNIMTKRGSEDNIVTYEHYCDTKADLANIPQDQISLGSVAIVLKDEDDAMGIYLANSNKEWISFSTSGGSSSSGPVLKWTQLAGPEDVFEYDSSGGYHTITIDDKFGCTTINDLEVLCRKWVFVKWTYNGETKYSYTMPVFEDEGDSIIVEWITTLASSSSCEVVVYAEYANFILSSVLLCVRGDGLPSDATSGISIYAAVATGWSE